jgi:hypothetical protein
MNAPSLTDGDRSTADPGRRVPRKSHVRISDPYERATYLLLHPAVVIVGADLYFGFGASIALPVAIILLPLWVRAARQYTLVPLIIALAVLAILMGLMLSELVSVDHAVSAPQRAQAIGLLLSGIAALVLLLWARQAMPLHRAVALYGAGGVLGSFATGHLSWKFALALPTTLLALGMVERFRGRMAPTVVVASMGVLGMLDDGRSFFGLCLLAATATMWQMRPGSRTTANRWFPAILMAGLAVALYFLITSLLIGGYLGPEAQTRTAAQVSPSGSLLIGGRPEWTATIELMKLQPLGYGPGVVPNWEDIQAGKAGLHTVDVELEPVRQRYMFGGQFRLHAVIADLWVGFGWAGVALAGGILVLLVRSLSFSLAERQASTSTTLLTFVAVWHLFFGTLYSNWLDVCAAVGLAAMVAARGRPPTMQVTSA